MSLQAVQLYNTILALLTLIALGGAVGLLVYRAVRGAGATALLQGRSIWIAWTVALVATVGSLVYSEVIGFDPCRLCWFQRIAMYPLAAVLLVGGLRREPQVKYYALPLSLAGLATSVYHYLVQIYPNLEGTACDPDNPCSLRYVETFGFISIPFMAGAAFIVISVLLAFYTRAKS